MGLRIDDVQRSKFVAGKPLTRFSIELLELAPGERCECSVLSDRWEWYDLHWCRGHHVICTAPSGFCGPCQEGVPATPKGFGFVLKDGASKQQLFKLTARMLVDEPRLKEGTAGRGDRLRIERPGLHAKGKTLVRVVGVAWELDKLPKSLCVGTAVCRIFGPGAEMKQQGGAK